MTKGQGWHGDSKGHAKAAKGETPTSKSTTTSGQGWHGDSKGHSKASKGETKDEKGLKDKLFGS